VLLTPEPQCKVQARPLKPTGLGMTPQKIFEELAFPAGMSHATKPIASTQT
jgi:hypothetical protein